MNYLTINTADLYTFYSLHIDMADAGIKFSADRVRTTDSTVSFVVNGGAAVAEYIVSRIAGAATRPCPTY